MRIWKHLIGLEAGVFALVLSSSLYAAGFQLQEQDISDLGRGYAGSAVTGDNAAIEFDNPAGMSQLKLPSISLSAASITAHSRFTGDAATDYYGESITDTATIKSENPFGTNIIPAVHAVYPINDKLYFGFGITEPYGMASDYSANGMARYYATQSLTSTTNINPSLAYQVNDHLSLGAGVDAQYLKMNIAAQLDTGGASPRNDAAISDSTDGWGYGYNFGLTYRFNPKTIAGFSYRSRIQHDVSGTFHVTYPSGLDPSIIDFWKNRGYRDGNVDISMEFPDTYLLSLSHEFCSQWTAMTSFSFTHWKLFDTMKFKYNTGATPILIAEDFHNSWRLSVGTDYHINDQWIARFGTAYDDSPVDDDNRNVGFPDSDRLWVTCGANYKFNPRVSLDFAYAHVFLKSAHLYESGPPPFLSSLTGHYNDTYADLIGLQLNWSF